MVQFLQTFGFFPYFRGVDGGGGGGDAHRYPYLGGHLTLRHEDESCSRKITFLERNIN